MSEGKEVYTTVVEGQIQQPAYLDTGERVNPIAPSKVKVMGTATTVDILLIIISLFNYLERYHQIPQEKIKVQIETLQRLLGEIAEEQIVET